MSFDISYINSYGYSIDKSTVNDTVNSIMNNSKNSNNSTDEIIVQKMNSNNSALLFEYTQGIAKSNVAQQLVLDANLNETLKFLNSQAAKRMLQAPKKKFGTYIEQIITNNNVNDFESDNKEKEDDIDELINFFGIEIDTSKENIFAA